MKQPKPSSSHSIPSRRSFCSSSRRISVPLVVHTRMGARYKAYLPRSLCSLQQDLSCTPVLPSPRCEQPARRMKGLQGWFRRKRGWSSLDTPSNCLTWCTCEGCAWEDVCPSMEEAGSISPPGMLPSLTSVWTYGFSAYASQGPQHSADTLQPYQITTLWTCTHTGQSNKSCRLPTSLRRWQLRCRPAPLPWLVSCH